jgi:hypothetical protein
MRRKFWAWLYKLSAAKLALPPKKRPTIAELEALLASDKDVEVLVLPDGSLTTV